MSEDEFVAAVTDGQSVAPAYFPFSAHRNRERHSLLTEHEPPSELTLNEVLEAQEGGAAVLDTRDAAGFAAGHLRGSLNVGLNGRFAEYAGDVVRPGQPVVLVCEGGHELEARVRLARIGFDDVIGALREPMRAFQEHPELVERGSRLTAGELASRIDRMPDVVVLDVRNPGERALGAIPESAHIPLAALNQRLSELDPSRPTVVYCAGGYRSSTAASVLSAAGFTDVSDLLGGYAAWTAAASPAR
jgi:hydroxyacylglutathione hydrolase